MTTATKDFKASVAENFIHTLPKPYKSDLRTDFTGPSATAFRRPVHNTKGRHVHQFRGFALLQRRYYLGAATGHAPGLSWTLTSGIKVILDVPCIVLIPLILLQRYALRRGSTARLRHYCPSLVEQSKHTFPRTPSEASLKLLLTRLL